jgi:hypothetical protein
MLKKFRTLAGAVAILIAPAFAFSQIVNPTPGGNGSGTVTSVGLALPNIFAVAGSPVTSEGTLTATFVSQSANTVLASPDGVAGIPSFRALTTGDIADSLVTAPKLATDSVTTAKILNSNVTTAKIADGNVTAAKLASGSALSNIGAGNVAASYLATGAALSNIGTGNITNSYLANMAAGTVKANLTGSTAAPADATIQQLRTAANINQCKNLLDAGGVANDSTDNSAAFAAAVSSLPAIGGCIYIPPGKYFFGSAQTVNFPATEHYGFSVYGAGTDITTLRFGNTDGFIINLNDDKQSVHMRDFSLTTTSTAGTNKGIYLKNSVMQGAFGNNDITRVELRGNDGGQATQYWGTAIDVEGVSNVNFINILVYGTGVGTSGNGIYLHGNTAVAPYYGIVYNISDSGFFNVGNGVVYGTYIQGVQINNTNFTNGGTAVFLPTGVVEAAQLAISNSQIDVQYNAVNIQSPIASIMLSNNLFYVAPGTAGVLLTSTGEQSTFTGNVFGGETNSGTRGISVQGNFSYSLAVGNVFRNLQEGVNLAGTSTWTVALNRYMSVGTPVASIGSNSVGVITQ